MITLRYRTVMAFAAGLAVALIGVFALQAWRADAAPGDNDTTFVPITPCRLLDTREPAWNIWGPDVTQSLPVHGVHGSCTIPTDAVGLSLNVTAVGASAPTFLTIWPDDQPMPTASSLNPLPGQPPTPNAVTTELAPNGRFRVYNLAGHVDVIIDINGYYTKTSLQQLANDIAALQSLTASMSLNTVDGQPTVRFNGVNLQIVDGTGETWGPVNGRGNLIVGYHEAGGGDDRTGSHNLIVGIEHSYSSYGGFLAGEDNTVSGIAASVSGGQGNTASGNTSSVSGGDSNIASGIAASASGGTSNTASGNWASASGGNGRSATGKYDWVAGTLFQDN